jgi:hypothetical protein
LQSESEAATASALLPSGQKNRELQPRQLPGDRISQLVVSFYLSKYPVSVFVRVETSKKRIMADGWDDIDDAWGNPKNDSKQSPAKDERKNSDSFEIVADPAAGTLPFSLYMIYGFLKDKVL